MKLSTISRLRKIEQQVLPPPPTLRDAIIWNDGKPGCVEKEVARRSRRDE